MTMSVVKNESNSKNEILDIIVVGGGINGAGIAADASGRGLKVGLYDAKDFASATSSASSKLIHGGLRYLEHYEFRLVSEALAEREVILRKAPHIAFPMRFRLPHRPFLRPAWMIRAGLFLYDHLGKRTSLPKSKKIFLDAGNVTKSEMKVGFEYSDCWVDDARLVILNALQAKEYGAEVKNYCSVVKAVRDNNHWTVTMKDHVANTTFTRKCRALVNATGPWVKEFIDENIDIKSPYGIRLIKGSHIIVPKIHDEEQSYILQNEDKRIVFVIPYLGKFSLIGTTDVEYKGEPREVEISDEERQYLVDVANKHFVKQISTKDIVSTYSGVRPLCDDESDSPQAITRDYTLSLDDKDNKAPLLSIFGGKLTTYRKLGESAMKQLLPFFPDMGKSWTANSLLPGAESFSKELLAQQLGETYPFLGKEMLSRWIHTYGSRVNRMLKNVKEVSDLGLKFSDNLYQIELDYLTVNEFAFTAEDILKRRTKLHLLLSEQECKKVVEYIGSTKHQEESKITA